MSVKDKLVSPSAQQNAETQAWNAAVKEERKKGSIGRFQVLPQNKFLKDGRTTDESSKNLNDATYFK